MHLAEGDVTDSTTQLDPAARRRLRVTFTAAGAVAFLYLLLPVLAAFTSVLDGNIGGVGLAYVFGFAEIVVVMAVAIGYYRWANRAEEEGRM
jgi:uncharacterized membrane protein (DUF485 family)